MSDNKEQRPCLRWRFMCLGTTVAIGIALDQITKAVVRNALALNGPGPEIIPGILRLMHVQNVGAAFSLGEGMGGAFVLLALFVVIAAVVYLYRTPLVSRVETFGLSLVCAGAIGNAIDRLLFGYVTDFLATEFIDFPIFNVADIAITVGVVVAFFGFMFLSPANQVDATAELNRRDEERRSRRMERSNKKGRS